MFTTSHLKQPDLHKPQVMGILNCTSDSFSDGGLFLDPECALQQAHRMYAEGATIIDVGGESMRPGAQAIDVEEELDRVIPIIERIHDEIPILISIDTMKPAVMLEALKKGAGFINDISALQMPGALEVAAASDVPICLMHMQGEPRTMQENPHYQDVVEDIADFFAERIQTCENAGIDKTRLVLDPGFGFGKTVAHNLQLISQLDTFKKFTLPLLIGVSRKSTIGNVLNKTVDKRLSGSLALTVLALNKGASIIRTHDVQPTVDALRMTMAVLS